jgi:hypothetical protein
VLAFADYIMNLALQNIDFAFSFDPVEPAETIKCNITGPALAMRFLLPAIEKSSHKVIVHTGCPTTASARLPSICLVGVCHLSLLAGMLTAISCYQSVFCP